METGGLIVRGLDVGRSIVKEFDGEVVRKYPAYVGEGRTLKNDRVLSDQDSVLTIHSENGEETYFTGGIAYDESEYGSKFMSVSKVHNDTRILTLSTLAKSVNDGQNVMLCINQPIDNHTKEEKEALKRLLTGSYDLTINGIRKKFDIKRVEVGAEAAISVWALAEIPRGYHHIIDLGSTTYNVATFKGKNWIDKQSFTEYTGVETVKNYSHSGMARLIASSFNQRIRFQKGRITLIGGKAKELQSHLAQYLRDVNVPSDYDSLNAKGLYNLAIRLKAEVAK